MYIKDEIQNDVLKNLENCHQIYHLNMMKKLKIDHSDNLPESIANVGGESRGEDNVFC